MSCRRNVLLPKCPVTIEIGSDSDFCDLYAGQRRNIFKVGWRVFMMYVCTKFPQESDSEIML